MKKICLILTMIILLGTTAVQAHTLYFTLMDNEDGTVDLAGMYSTGEAPVATPVRLINTLDNSVIWQGKTDENGECTFNKPTVPYEVELDAGPGHTAREDGI
ncbi:hypothetical protein [Maridesulfovibrio sp.]|uniref:hypothetical protein n=1 Tax=Maridesulfovibrio sp. TaxID=2795000 RepID=UPI003BA9CD39